MEKVKISPEEVSNKFQSKQDLFKLLKYKREELHIIFIVGYFLPGYRDCNMKYLRGIMNGEKTVYKTNNIKPIDVPNYHELSVKNIWSKLKTDDEFCKYMPDSYLEKTPERTFFFAILSTLYPDKLQSLINDAISHRSAIQAEADDDLIEVTLEIKEAIDNILVGKVTRGRAFQLLKKEANLEKRKPQSRRYDVNLAVFDESEEEKKEDMNIDIDR